VYIEIHEDSEHRRNTRSRAQQIFSQALSKADAVRYTARGHKEGLWALPTKRRDLVQAA